MNPGLILGGIKLLGGLLGSKKKNKGPTPRQNLLSQAAGAREAAEKYGFNPLTMLQYGQTGGSMASGGAPPLASLDLLVDGAADIADEVSGDVDRRRKADQLNLDLLELKVDQARSGVYVAQPPGAVRGGEFSPARFTSATPTTTQHVPTPYLGMSMKSGPVDMMVGDNTPAEDAEAQYGDLMGSVFGYANYMTDVGSAVGRAWDRNVNPMIVEGVTKTWPAMKKRVAEVGETLTEAVSEDPNKRDAFNPNKMPVALPGGGQIYVPKPPTEPTLLKKWRAKWGKYF